MRTERRTSGRRSQADRSAPILLPTTGRTVRTVDGVIAPSVRQGETTRADAVETYSYTKRGQPEGMTLSVGSESFAAKMTYDDVGRAKSLEYPWPLGEQPFGVTYDYDAHGHRVGVRDTYTNSAYWQLTDVDQAGRYKHEQFGNGVTTARGYFLSLTVMP